MAQIKSFDARIAELDQFIALSATVKTRLIAARDYEEQELSNGILIPNDFLTRIEGILTGLAALSGTDLKAAIDLFTSEIETWPVRLSKSVFFDTNAWTSVDVDVISGSDATLTINQTGTAVDIFGTGTTVIQPADIIKISNAEDPNHDGFHTVKAAGVAAQVLTLDANMLGEDNANDETMIITLVER